VPLSAVAPDVPPSVVAVIDRALAKEPGARFSSAREMYDALTRSAGGLAHTAMHIPATLPGTPATLPMGGPGSVPSRVPSTAAGHVAATPPKRRWLVPLVAVFALGSMCLVGSGAGALVARDRLDAAWTAFLGAPATERAAGDDPSLEPAGDTTAVAQPPAIPMHDGNEEVVGGAGMSIERCSRRRAEDGRWIVDMPVTLRNAGEAALTFQQSELAADGYVATAESDFPVFGMLAPDRAFSGFMVWRASTEGAPPETITIRFRGWSRRVPVTDGPRLPPRPAASDPDP
jgi:hypothetical protein